MASVLDRSSALRQRMYTRLLGEIEAEKQGVGHPVLSHDEMPAALERRVGSDTGDWHSHVRLELAAALGRENASE
jgi:hypothetical protein